MEQERIIAAAIQIRDAIICGKRHDDCIDLYASLPGKTEEEAVHRTMQGFLTSEFRFVDRYDAMDIAIAS